LKYPLSVSTTNDTNDTTRAGRASYGTGLKKDSFSTSAYGREEGCGCHHDDFMHEWYEFDMVSSLMIPACIQFIEITTRLGIFARRRGWVLPELQSEPTEMMVDARK
jgi:hypothetical protein